MRFSKNCVGNWGKKKRMNVQRYTYNDIFHHGSEKFQVNTHVIVFDFERSICIYIHTFACTGPAKNIIIL